MAQFLKHFTQDLAQDLKIRQCGTLVFNADDLSNVISVDVYNNGEPATLSGTVVGAVICSDGSTVPISNGTVSGNTVTITLTAACFAIPGPIGVGIQLNSSGVKTTILKAVYNVEKFTTDDVVDPDSRITLSVSDLIDDITDAVNELEAAIGQIPADYSDLMAAIAPTFNATTEYTTGKYVWYDGSLYRFNTDHAAGAWNASQVDAAVLSDKVAATESAVNNLKSLEVAHSPLDVGTVTKNVTLTSDGKGTTANNNRILSDFIPVTPGERIYITIAATTERCAFYSAANYADVVGSTFTISAGSPSYKDVPTGCYYMKIGWHKNNPPTALYRIAPFIDDSAGAGALDKVWSANKSSAETAALSAGITGAETNISAIIGKAQFEAVDATIETGYYKYDGTRGSGDAYRTATASVTAGEILKVSGYTLASTSFYLIVYFDANDDFLSNAYRNNGSTVETYTDLVVTVPQGAAKIGVNCMNSNAALGIKRMANIASVTQVNTVDAKADSISQKADDIGRYVNYEHVIATVEAGFYNAVSGEWTANASYSTIRFPAQKGECFLINGYIPSVAGLATCVVFNDQDEIVGLINDGRQIATGAGVTDYFVYVPFDGADSMAVLGAPSSDHPNYADARRGIIKYAHTPKNGICFGDSTFGNTSPYRDIPHWLSVKTGNNVLNGAFGGCRMSSYNGNYGAFSMYSLADAIVNDTWTAQDAALADTGWEPPAYAAEHLANLKSTDWDKVDFITIAYGTNDWRAGKPLDNEQNPTDTNSIAGALRYSLNELMAAFPQIDVYVLAPLWRVVKLDGDTEENPTGYCDTTPNGLTVDPYYLMDVCAVLKSVCDEYHVTYVDDFNIGINKYNWKNWLVDGTHPNQNGVRMMTDNLVKNIRGIVY